MPNLFKTKGAAHYAEGCGPSDPPPTYQAANTSQESLSKAPISEKKDATTTVTSKPTSPSNPPTSTTDAKPYEPPSWVTEASEYPPHWPPEKVAYLERLRLQKNEKEAKKSEKDKDGTKGAKRGFAAVESVAVGLAVGIVHLF